MAVNVWVHGFKRQKSGVVTANTVRATALILSLFWRLCNENLQISGAREFITQVTTTCHVSMFCVTWNTAQVHPAYIFKIHFNIILPSSASSSHWFLSFLLPQKNPVHIPLLPIYATCPTLLLILDLITLIISGEEQKSQTHNYAVFSSPLTLFLVMSNHLPQRSTLKPWAYAFPSLRDTTFHTHTKQKTNLQSHTFSFLYFKWSNREYKRFRMEWR